MRRPSSSSSSSNRVCLELRKELGRSSNLAWVAALLVWLVLGSSGYAHFFRSKWLSGTQTTHDSLRSTRLASSQSYELALRVPLLELDDEYADNDTNQTEDFRNPKDPFVEPRNDYDGSSDDHSQSLPDEEAVVTPHLYQALHRPTDDDRVDLDDVEGLHDLGFKQSTDKSLVYNGLQAVKAAQEQSRLKPLLSHGSHKVHSLQAEPTLSKPCATVEDMGLLAATTLANSSLQVRKMIKKYFSQHGASHVRELPAEKFCRRGFVFGRAAEDGLGNDIYKILTAAGLSIMLNRSLIIAEHGSLNPAYFELAHHVRVPFGDYLSYSNETFSLSEVKHLWVKHDCAGLYRRPLTMIVDDFQRPTRTKVFCEDWSKWRHPVIWFKGTTDSNALQFFLKNQYVKMRESARLLFGDPSKPSSRPNVFGELFKAFISPKPVIEEAVSWALQDSSNLDIAIHMRMLNSRSRTALYTACSCIWTALKRSKKNNSLPSVVIVSDTPRVIRHFKEQLAGFAKVIHFDPKGFMDSHHNLSKVMTGTYFRPPEKRVKDWGAMPRWVAIVDMFLAAKARVAVISGANRRVGTTFAQLVASLAAATTTDEERGSTSFKFYSSFQTSLLAEGLAGQRGWGHVWRRFAGHLSCKNQTAQCALTPILSYAWWDGPWQSPAPRDSRRMLAYGIKLSNAGHVEESSLPKTCMSRKAHLDTVQLMLPSCKRLKMCRQ